VTDPVILFFLFGLVCGLLKIDLKLPKGFYPFLSAYLLLSIGLKGGLELRHVNLQSFGPQAIAVILMGVFITVFSFPILKGWGRFDRDNAASIAAHYGSVSVGTFAAGIAFLQQKNISFESYVPLFVVLLEVPAIIVGIVLAKGVNARDQLKPLLREVFFGKSIVLLVGGLVIGAISGEENFQGASFLFFDLFKGALALFLLEMGQVTADRASSLKKSGAFLIGFAVIMPLFGASLGGLLGVSLGLSVGGATILAILAASSSYIAVPAAMSISLPKANQSLSLGASLGVTFPFNVTIGIPLYYYFVKMIDSYLN